MIELIAKLNSEIKKDLPDGKPQKFYGITPGRVYKVEADDIFTNRDGTWVEVEIAQGGKRIVNIKRFIRK